MTVSFDIDLTGMEDSIYVLQKNAFRYLASDSDLDTVTDPGACYRGTEEKNDGMNPSAVSRDFIFVAGTGSLFNDGTHDVTQYLINRNGISMRRHYSASNILEGPARWDEWQLIGAIEEAPQDGKIYARKNGHWVAVTATEAPFLSVSPAEVTIPAAGTAQAVEVASNKEWTVD
jgi:hypothetical protein